jgi:hypothetical protein
MKKAHKSTHEFNPAVSLFSNDFKGIQDIDLIEEIKKILDTENIDDSSKKPFSKKSEQ